MIKQIKIEELIPFMKKGWVACDKDGTWRFWTTLPLLEDFYTYWQFDLDYITEESEAENLSVIFNITPAEDWTKSLIKIGGK